MLKVIMKILDIFRTGKAEAGEDPEALEAQETAAAAPEVLQAPAVEDLEAQDAAAAAPETDRTKEEELEAWKEKMLRRLRGTSEKGY